MSSAEPVGVKPTMMACTSAR